MKKDSTQDAGGHTTCNVEDEVAPFCSSKRTLTLFGEPRGYFTDVKLSWSWDTGTRESTDPVSDDLGTLGFELIPVPGGFKILEESSRAAHPVK